MTAADVNKISSKFFARFSSEVLGKEIDAKLSAASIIRTQNNQIMRIASCIVFFVNIFWMAYDALLGGHYVVSNLPIMILLTGTCLLSVYMFFLPKLPVAKNEFGVRFSYIVYYISILACITGLMIAENVLLATEGLNSPFSTIFALSTYYLIILVIAPLPAKRDSLIILAAVLILLFVPIFAPGAEKYIILQEIVVRTCMIIAYIIVWQLNKRTATLEIKQEVSNRKLTRSVYTDELTRLLNQRAMNEYAAHLRESGCKNLGVVLVNIDDFKSYNDEYTHKGGDELLQALAGILQREAGDGYLFRYSGNSFITFLSDPTDEELLRLGMNMSKAVWGERLKRSDLAGSDRVSVTIGCAMHELKDGSDFISEADNQVYNGKINGKNCVEYKNWKYQFN